MEQFETPLGYVKRPMNAFMVYARLNRPILKRMHPGIPNSEISKKLGDQWRELSDANKAQYYAQANALSHQHQQLYPGYTYRPGCRQAFIKATEDKPWPSGGATSSTGAATLPGAATPSNKKSATGYSIPAPYNYLQVPQQQQPSTSQQNIGKSMRFGKLKYRLVQRSAPYVSKRPSTPTVAVEPSQASTSTGTGNTTSSSALPNTSIPAVSKISTAIDSDNAGLNTSTDTNEQVLAGKSTVCVDGVTNGSPVIQAQPTCGMTGTTQLPVESKEAQTTCDLPTRDQAYSDAPAEIQDIHNDANMQVHADNSSTVSLLQENTVSDFQSLAENFDYTDIPFVDPAAVCFDKMMYGDDFFDHIPSLQDLVDDDWFPGSSGSLDVNNNYCDIPSLDGSCDYLDLNNNVINMPSEPGSSSDNGTCSNLDLNNNVINTPSEPGSSSDVTTTAADIRLELDDVLKDIEKYMTGQSESQSGDAPQLASTVQNSDNLPNTGDSTSVIVDESAGDQMIQVEVGSGEKVVMSMEDLLNVVENGQAELSVDGVPVADVNVQTITVPDVDQPATSSTERRPAINGAVVTQGSRSGYKNKTTKRCRHQPYKRPQRQNKSNQALPAQGQGSTVQNLMKIASMPCPVASGIDQ